MSIHKSFLRGVKLARMGFSEPVVKLTSTSFAVRAGFAKHRGDVNSAEVLMKNAIFYSNTEKRLAARQAARSFS